MHTPIGILNRNSTMIITSAIVKSKNMFNSNLPCKIFYEHFIK